MEESLAVRAIKLPTTHPLSSDTEGAEKHIHDMWVSLLEQRDSIIRQSWKRKIKVVNFEFIRNMLFWTQICQKLHLK